MNQHDITFHLFCCEKCKYKTNVKKDYLKHLSTLKHNNKLIKQNSGQYACECEQKFNNRTSLWRHRKMCNNQDCNVDMSANAILELVKQNTEFKQLLIEQNQKIIEISSKPTNVTNNTNNTINKSFNLNFFLNETCKDALNITDFVDSLKLKLEDLENVGKNGFVEGISQIFITGLKQLDVYKRPIHCSDAKRETLYVKDDNIWEKENEEKNKLTKSIKHIAHKNIKQIPTWVENYPDCSDYYSKQNNTYLNIVSESMGGGSDCENDKYYKKIVKNISKEVLIDNSCKLVN